MNTATAPCQMTNSEKYTCSGCGLIHDDWPALAFNSPGNYDQLSGQDKQTIAELNTDFCSIRYAEQTDRFIHCTLSQKVIGHCETLEYGLWVSLSEKSFLDYSENFHNEDHETSYFGWLCNDLPDYDFSGGSIPTTVVTKPGNQRPEIIPHRDFNHPFVRDYYLGIGKSEAERRICQMLKTLNEKDEVTTKAKPWWRFW